ncbi:glycoside hydrolase family 3 N-terminal domain-containing protein [Kribbella sp. NPDC056345]|uniref:glycoside hydrolase family 3 N-terminal domain-containing protein n=1 Tax=Kribbella sp. NPDC056345 TaxID=3345789 RepID=UPI0035D86EDE
MPAPLSPAAERWVDDWLGRLTPAQKIAHCLLVLPTVGPDGLPDAATRHALELGVGTLHSVRDLPASTATAYHGRVAEICAEAGLPPALISGNLEAGIMYSLRHSGTHFPYPRGLGNAGDPDLAYRVAAATAAEARAVGYHWTFSPCIDVVSVPDDPILGVRAYGVPAPLTGSLGAAQIRGYQDNGVLATAKHFPGHGDSSIDSHLAQPVVHRTPADHESIHRPPFADAVAAGVATIMVAHIAYPILGIDVPASLSPTVNRTWLRHDLGFNGLIITDALHMDAIARHHTPTTAALLALQAGADVANVKCTPEEIAPIIKYLLAALDNGTLSEADLDNNVRRLLGARTLVGLHAPAEPRTPLADTPATWTDPQRPATVDLHAGDGTALSPVDGFVVVGDSELARRVVELGVRRGLSLLLEPEPLTPGVLNRVAPRHPGAHLIPVFGPGPIPAAQQWKDVAAVTADAPHPCPAVIVNSTLPAHTFGDVADRVISVPAMDAFDIVTDAAVHATLDVLF